MKIHVIRQGDTLLDLTQKYNVPLERILEANPDMTQEADGLSAGSKVRIPTGKISLQKNQPMKNKVQEEEGEPLFKEPAPTIVEETSEGTNPTYAEHGMSDKSLNDTAAQQPPSYSSETVGEPAQAPMSNEYGYHWSYYGPYYPQVSHYSAPNYMPQPFYPVNYMQPQFAPPMYQQMPHTNIYEPEMQQEPIAQTSSYQPEIPPYYFPVGYPGCVPCTQFPEESAHRRYREEQWKR